MVLGTDSQTKDDQSLLLCTYNEGHTDVGGHVCGKKELPYVGYIITASRVCLFI